MSERMFSIDRFLGLNEGADGLRELKMGEASRLVNFAITNDRNLKLRPGVRKVPMPAYDDDLWPLAMWSGYVGETEMLVFVGWDEYEEIYIFKKNENGEAELLEKANGSEEWSKTHILGIGENVDPHVVKIFPFAGKLYIMSEYECVVYDESGMRYADFYVPIVLTGTKPDGGGTILEEVNLLTKNRRVKYSADGSSTAYKLPEEAKELLGVLVNGEDKTADGSFNAESHTFTFTEAPPEGANNVEISYAAEADNLIQIGKCPYYESYNGTTETRLWFYGDGTNKVYYTGVPLEGDLSKLYVPAMSEVAVDLTPSAVTGLVRHYNRLFAYKADGACTITYQPTTLEDGRVIAGFTVRNVRKDIGNEAPGQVRLVNNYPRTFSHANLYEWRTPTNYLVDERYEKSISFPIRKTLEGADFKKIVVCDDNQSQTYYVFLNDSKGTVLVNRPDLEAWTIYRSNYTKDVIHAVMFSGRMYFARKWGGLWYLDENSLYDGIPSEGAEQGDAIEAVWESGFMDFGAPTLRKYSSYIWVSMLPQPSARLTVTAETDRRDEYTEKDIYNGIFDENWIDYGNWSYESRRVPKIDRIKLKVKKFVYYKLILKVEAPGTAATVLSINQAVRYSGKAK